MDRTGTGWQDPEPPKGPDRLFAFAGRHRGASIAAAVALAVLAGTALQLASLAARFAEGPSAEAAIADANETNRRELNYSLVSERTEPDGSVVYRLVSDSEPPVYYEQRYRFRWFPELSISPGMPIPSIDMPGPYYELANEDEWRQSWLEWDSEQLRQEAESGGSLRAKLRQERSRPSEGGPVHETDSFFYAMG